MKPNEGDGMNNRLRRTLQVLVVIGAGLLVFFILKPFQANIYLFEGYKAAVHKEWPAALEAYEKAQQLDPWDGELQFYYGYANLKAKNYDEAAAHFLRSLETKLDPSAFNNLGNVYLEQGKLKEAETAYQQALHTQVSRKFSLNNLGCVYQKTGRLEAAEMMFQEALSSASNYQVAKKNLKVVESLLEQYSYVMQRYGADLVVHLFTAKTYADMGDTERASREYRQAADIMVRRDENLGDELSRKQGAELAANVQRIAQLYSRMGQALVRSGEIAPAISIYTTTLQLNPRNQQKLFQYIGSLYDELGDKEKAAEWLRRASSAPGEG